MGEYYGVQRSEEYLAHYGVLGMKWGIRNNPQKDFYKGMKKHFKTSLKNNKAKHDFNTSAIGEIGKSIPDKKLSKYNRYSKELDRIGEKQNDLENYIYHLRNHENKEPTKNQLKKMNEVNKKSDAALKKYKNEVKRLSDEYLGKYAKRKIRTDSPYVIKRKRADYLFEAALRSRKNI